MIFWNFALKTFDTLKMFLFSFQNNFLYYVEFICRRVCEKKASLIFMSFVAFEALEIRMSFWEIFFRARFEIIFRQK